MTLGDVEAENVCNWGIEWIVRRWSGSVDSVCAEVLTEPQVGREMIVDGALYRGQLGDQSSMGARLADEMFMTWIVAWKWRKSTGSTWHMSHSWKNGWYELESSRYIWDRGPSR